MRKLSTTRCSGRAAFTLVELLLVVTIIAILASLGVGIMSQAQEDARVAGTRSRISLIEKILETELEDFEVRRPPVSVREIETIVNNASFTGNQTRLHIKQLRRMIIADLIRVQMPDGSQVNPNLAQFPSPILQDYLAQIGAGAGAIPTSNRGIAGQVQLNDNNAGDQFDADALGKSELLYLVLSSIDVDGVPAVDLLGSSAVGNTGGSATPEILDAWGDPMYLQWQQENLLPSGNLEANQWESNGTFVGLSKEHRNAGFNRNFEYSKPVLPSQIRPLLISARLSQIDGLPNDIPQDHRHFSAN